MSRRRVQPSEPDRALGVPLEVAEAWQYAYTQVFGHGPAWEQPTILAHREVPAGHRLTVRLPVKVTVKLLAEAAEWLAGSLDIRDVRVTAEPASKGRAHVTLVLWNPFAGQAPVAWPLLHSTAPVSLWEPIPTGIDEDGTRVATLLAYRNLLVGGEPGAGKSVAQSLFVAAAALDPGVRLYLFDGKWVELFPWAEVAEKFVGPKISEANNVLEVLRADMDTRLEWLADHKRRKITPADGFAITVVVIDELALFTNNPAKKEADYFNVLATDLVARGRAPGYWVIAATQKPEGSVVPTNLRDLFALRWAMRCNTSDASDTILGKGMASAGFNAATIDMATRGVGWLKAEGVSPRLLRSDYLDDADLAALADRAATLRADQQGAPEQGKEVA